MKIVVCIKQVPDTVDIKWTENNTIDREGVESVINPFDMYALEMAFRIKEKCIGATVTVLTMGPFQAEEILKKAISLGADEAFLITDKKFAGADTVATSRTLAAAIKTVVPDFDVIVCGQFAVDGDTAQTGPSIAQHLGLAQVTYVKNLITVEDDCVVVKKELEDGEEVLKASLPVLLTTLKCDFEPRRAYIGGFVKAQNYKIERKTLTDIGLSADEVGIKGSPTYVSKAFRPEPKIGGQVIDAGDTNLAVDKIMEFLEGGENGK